LKGCVRGYGNYDKLTSSGVDPTELFDDIKDCGMSPDLVQPDIVVEECEDTNQEDIKSLDHTHLLPIEKKRRCIRSKQTKSNHGSIFDSNCDPLSEEISLYTTPSLFSLISTHNNLDSIKGAKKVIILTSQLSYNNHSDNLEHAECCTRRGKSPWSYFKQNIF